MVRTLATTIEIDATPAEVWATLIDFPSHERWNPFFASIEGDAVVGESLTLTARKPDGGRGMVFTPTVLQVDEREMLRWKGRLFVPGLFDAEHKYRLVDLGGGRTRLDHSEDFGGILIPLMGGVLADTESGFHAFNKALAEEVAARRGAGGHA